MEQSVSQTVKREPTRLEKAKQMLGVFGSVILLGAVTLFTGGRGWLSVVLYLGCFVLIYLLYRSIMHAQARYAYAVADHRFLVVQIIGRVETTLLDLTVDELEKLRSPVAGDATHAILAVQSLTHPANQTLVFDRGRAPEQLLFTPNAAVLAALQQQIQNHQDNTI